MHCGVMVTGYNQADWPRLLDGDYDRAPDVPDHVHMDETLRLGELVEPLGYDSIWATEHYGSAYSMQPNPLQYLAYWAGRTSRVDLGTAVVVAPWWNPVRLASELSMLDILLKGRRLHLGIGRGTTQHEYGSLGIPIEESHKYFYDVVDAIRVADRSERFSFNGQVYKIPPTTIRPQARHKGDVTTNIKVAFSTPSSAQMAAEHGLGMIFVSDDDVDAMRAKVSGFNQIRAGLGFEPAQPTTLLYMYCAETEELAKEGKQWVRNQVQAAQNHYFEWNNAGLTKLKGYEHYENNKSADVGQIAVGEIPVGGIPTGQMKKNKGPNSNLVGTPEQLIERIKWVQEAISLDTLVVHFFYGGMPPDKAEASLRLFAKEVLPAVQAMPTPLQPGCF
jgi:alkanesulfonate monooxygenase SsuD/methylene tetrahydromethanopterin reductase-like flavin-dependent oxidoreductase (luciferase family)